MSKWIRARMSGAYDIIVVGGGPAGLSTAQSASENGAKVLLLELQAQIGGQTQTSAWTSTEVLGEKFGRAIVSPVKKVNVRSPHQKLEIKGNFGKIVDRKILDKILASEAVSEGVDIWVSSPVRELLNENNKIRGVKAEAGEWSEEIEGELVIDATGAKSEWSSLFLRKVLDSDWDKERISQTNEYLMANASGKDELGLYFNSILSPGGHAWIYPLEREFCMAGIRGVRIHPDSALDEFIGTMEPKRLKESVPIGAYRGRLPDEGPLKSTSEDNILAVGASAGQVYPLSGHGIKYSLEAGKIAGRIAAESVEEGDKSKERLGEYENTWRSKFEKEIQAGEIIRSALEVSPDQKMDALLKVLKRRPKLQKDFVNIFRAMNLKASLKRFFKEKECERIFGKNNLNKILSLYS